MRKYKKMLKCWCWDFEVSLEVMKALVEMSPLVFQQSAVHHLLQLMVDQLLLLVLLMLYQLADQEREEKQQHVGGEEDEQDCDGDGEEEEQGLARTMSDLEMEEEPLRHCTGQAHQYYKLEEVKVPTYE